MTSPYTINVVCTGNICRSPMGEVILRDAIELAGLTGSVVVESSGTGDWHVGGGADHRAEEVIARNKLSLAGHVVSQFTTADFDRADLILIMDDSHLRSLTSLARDEADKAKIRLYRSFDPQAVDASDLNVNDPYFGDYRDFEIAYDLLSEATPGIIDFVRTQIAAQP